MTQRPWWALATVVVALGGLIPMEASAQLQKPRPELSVNQRLAREARVTEAQAARVFNALGPVLRDELKKGNTVSIPGLGTLRVVRIAEHRDMEIGTGRVLRIPAKNTVEFLAGEALGEAANSATAVPAETVPAFERDPLPDQTKGQKVPPTRSEGLRSALTCWRSPGSVKLGLGVAELARVRVF